MNVNSSGLLDAGLLASADCLHSVSFADGIGRSLVLQPEPFMFALLAAVLSDGFVIAAGLIGVCLAPWLTVRTAWRSCGGFSRWKCVRCGAAGDLVDVRRSTWFGIFPCCNQCGGRLAPGWWLPITGILCGLLFGGFVAAVQAGWQATPEVRPPDWAVTGRAAFHLVLLACLVAATATDLVCYIIPDRVTVWGTIFAVTAATASGQFQLIHIWVDWTQEVPGLRGPYIPEWCGLYEHLHGFVWSVTGGLFGGGLTWLVRGLASHALRQEAMGQGDITLMTMIGCFLGWQPTLLAFLLAPFCGIFVGAIVKFTANRPYVPYGPFLAVAAIVVMTGWTWLWTPLRYVFGDPVILAVLGGTALAALWLLLTGVRLYRSIPVRSERPERLEREREPDNSSNL